MTWKLFFLEIRVSSLSPIRPRTDVGHLCSLISAWGMGKSGEPSGAALVWGTFWNIGNVLWGRPTALEYQREELVCS